MSPIAISALVFASVFGGALAGIALRASLPEHHLSSESKEVIKLSMGLVATMTALVLGLLVASAKESYDTQDKELTEMASRFVMVDRLLARYGPETKDARDLMRVAVTGAVGRLDNPDSARALERTTPTPSMEVVSDRILTLEPKDDRQRELKFQATEITKKISEARWLMFEQRAGSFSKPFLYIVACWITLTFMSFGLFAKPNPTATSALFVAAFSVSTAIFLILEMYAPYSGLIRISIAPLRAALAHLGQ